MHRVFRIGGIHREIESLVALIADEIKQSEVECDDGRMRGHSRIPPIASRFIEYKYNDNIMLYPRHAGRRRGIEAASPRPVAFVVVRAAAKVFNCECRAKSLSFLDCLESHFQASSSRWGPFPGSHFLVEEKRLGGARSLECLKGDAGRFQRCAAQNLPPLCRI